VLEEASPKNLDGFVLNVLEWFSPSISICPFCMSKGETTNETYDHK